MSAPRLISPMRHACTGCGGSCQGVNVRLLDEERDAILTRARDLGVDEPLVEGRLRRVEGSCVFLDEDRRCQLHDRWGIEAKPVMCRQYPIVAVRVAGDLRIGLDPGCYSAIGSWKDGPSAAMSGLVAHAVDSHPSQIEAEAALERLCALPGLTLPALLRALTGVGTDEAPDPGLASRWVETLQRADLSRLVRDESAGPALRDALADLVETAAEWSIDDPPAWTPLTEAQRAWTVEVVRRMVALRLVPGVDYVMAVAALTALGAMGLGWLGLDDEGFGRAMAGWSRALRAAPFLRALAPDPERLRWLLRGGES